jgi:transcriptional regulator with XRE-family HTH domain
LNERLKKLRKALDLTQQEFADRIGVKRNTIATYEIGRNTPLDAVIASICREFNVSETWLRTGEGEMFLPSPNGVLDELVQKYGLSTRGKVIVEKFLDLNPDVQEAVAVYIEKVAAAFSDAGTSAPVPVFAPADLRAEHTATESEDPELEAEVEAYRQRRLQEKRPGLQTSAVKGRGAV